MNITTELLELFEKSLAEGKARVAKAAEDNLLPTWTLRNGEEIYSESLKAEVIRMCKCTNKTEAAACDNSFCFI